MMLVCGLGTGRCGTKSLAELLRRNGFDAVHERKPALAWEDEPNPFRHFRKRNSAWFADVGFYYLPHVRRLMEYFGEMRFVCLKRDRRETIESFVRRRPEETHWFADDGQPDGWDRSFPTYNCEFAAAVGRYWDDYYREAESLQCHRFRVYQMENLNCPRCVEDLLRFVGVDDPNVVTGIRLTY